MQRVTCDCEIIGDSNLTLLWPKGQWALRYYFSYIQTYDYLLVFNDFSCDNHSNNLSNILNSVNHESYNDVGKITKKPRSCCVEFFLEEVNFWK